MDFETANHLWAYEPETGLFRWRVDRGTRARVGQRAGSHQGDGYRQLTYNGRMFKEHRVAWLLRYGHWPVHEIDHINGMRSDNRIANLRDVPHRLNQLNQKCHRNAGVVTEILPLVTSCRDKKVTAAVTASRAHAPSGLSLCHGCDETARDVTCIRDSDIAPLRCDNVTITAGA